MLVQNARHTLQQIHAWEIPKGGWEQDETMEEAACRETFEEAGLKGFLEVGITTRMKLTGQRGL